MRILLTTALSLGMLFLSQSGICSTGSSPSHITAGDEQIRVANSNGGQEYGTGAIRTASGHQEGRGSGPLITSNSIPVTITRDLKIQRDWIDRLSLGVNLAVLLFIGIQARFLVWTFVADHRPRLIIRHMWLLTDPEEVLVADEDGNAVGSSVELAFILSNGGGSRCVIVERNVSFEIIGRGDNIAEMIAARDGNLPLPPIEKETGKPKYETNRTIREKLDLRADEERLLKVATGNPTSTDESVNMALVLSKKAGIDHIRFFATGYFVYRDFTGPRYTNAFCRYYDRKAGKFVSVDDQRYEYTT